MDIRMKIQPDDLSFYGADKIKLDELIASDKLWAEPLNKETDLLAGQVVWAVRKRWREP